MNGFFLYLKSIKFTSIKEFTWSNIKQIDYPIFASKFKYIN